MNSSINKIIPGFIQDHVTFQIWKVSVTMSISL